MPKPISRHFKASISTVKLKGTPVLEAEEVTVEDAHVALTMKLPASKTNIRIMDFLNSAKSQKTVDVQIESAQLELLDDLSS